MKQLSLPKKVQVGDKWYSVDVVESMQRKSEIGRVYYDTRRIEVARRTQRGIPFKLAALEETFWHELTHAILHDMGEHQLNNRENFVEEFASRLSRAIRTARF